MAFWPSRADFRFAERMADDLGPFIEHTDRLAEIIKLAKQQDYDFAASRVIDKISKTTSIDPSTLAVIFNALENFRAIADEIGGAEAAFNRVRRAVADAVDDDDLIKKLDASKDKIIAAITSYDQDNPVSISFKAQKLTYFREKLFHEAEIITDARPVFDAKGENILEMVITHSLVITYWTAGTFQTMHLAIDAADVLDLRKAADRAVIKGKTLKNALQTKWKTEVPRDDA